jgi:hypothetical protein
MCMLQIILPSEIIPFPGSITHIYIQFLINLYMTFKVISAFLAAMSCQSVSRMVSQLDGLQCPASLGFIEQAKLERFWMHND